jgi:hypothetical protein
MGGTGALAVWIAATSPGSKFPIWPAFVLGVVAVIGLYLCFAMLHSWWPVGRRGRDEWPWEEEFPRKMPLGVGLGMLIPDPPGPLELKLEDERWDIWQGIVVMAELKIRIAASRPIRLAAFNLESDPGTGERPRLNQAQRDAVYKEIQRRREAHRSSYLHPVDMLAGDSISRWYVKNVYLPYPERAGHPRCTFIVTDGAGDTYRLEIPARPPQSY